MNPRKALTRKVGYFWGRRYLAVARCKIFAEVALVCYVLSFYLLFISLLFVSLFFIWRSLVGMDGALDYH